MLITEKLTGKWLSVKSNYSEDYVSRFRKIDGATFEKENKRWLIPVQAFDQYESLFPGEIIYKTPRWLITGEPAPDYSAMYHLNRNIPLPAMKLQPFDYQKYGIKFMVNKLLDQGFCINADDVGLGKTPQAIGVIKYMVENHGLDRIIIACKKSIKRQWCAEIKKFTDLDKDLYILPIEGEKGKRKKLYKEFLSHPKGIMVMNYHIIMNDTEELKKMGFKMVIIDEAHCVKARTGALNGAIREVAIQCDYTVFLTGTPIMSKPEDIFGVIQIADPKYFGKWKDFEKKFIKQDFTGRFVRVVGYKRLDELRAMVQDIVIRRTEFEVTLELPKTVMNTIECDIDKTQVAIDDAIKSYRFNLLEKIKEIEAKTARTPEDLQKKEKAEAMIKGLLAADQANANDPRLFWESRSMVLKKQFGELVPASYKGSAKLEALVDLVESILDSGEKVIIFSKFETSAKLVCLALQSRLKVKTLLYSGSVGEEDREDAIDLFRNSSDHNVIVGTDALAEGVNLQVANHVINVDQPDQPATKTQRGGRARRAGSTYDRVFVHDLITVESRDQERLQNIEKAQGLFDGIVSVDAAQSGALKTAMAGV